MNKYVNSCSVYRNGEERYHGARILLNKRSQMNMDKVCSYSCYFICMFTYVHIQYLLCTYVCTYLYVYACNFIRGFLDCSSLTFRLHSLLTYVLCTYVYIYAYIHMYVCTYVHVYLCCRYWNW